MSNHGQILERYTFPNLFKIVHHQKKKKVPAAMTPQDNETSRVMEFLDNSEDSQGMLLLWSIVHLRSHFNLR